jgi:hypothetical protein
MIKRTSVGAITISDIIDGIDGYGANPHAPTIPKTSDITIIASDSVVSIRWGNPNFQGYLETKVYRQEHQKNVTPNFSSSVYLSSAYRNFNDTQVTPDTTYSYWIKYVSTAQIVGQASAAVTCTTAVSLDLREGWLGQEQLKENLRTRIELNETAFDDAAEAIELARQATVSAQGLAEEAFLNADQSFKNADAARVLSQQAFVSTTEAEADTQEALNLAQQALQSTQGVYSATQGLRVATNTLFNNTKGVLAEAKVTLTSTESVFEDAEAVLVSTQGVLVDASNVLQAVNSKASTVSDNMDEAIEAAGLAEEARGSAVIAFEGADDARVAALVSKTDAETAASAAVQARTDSQGNASASLSAKNSAESAAQSSVTAKTSAQGSASSALSAKTAAVNAKTSAETSASAAASSATDADGSASAALVAKTDSVNAKTAASNSAQAATQAKTDAAGSASAALSAKSDAQNAATGSGTSAEAAAVSKTDAAGSASSALSSKSSALSSKNSASTSAAAAVQSKTDAAGSASAALSAKSDAQDAATGASNSASSAVQAKTDAAGSASAALSAKTDSVNAATGSKNSATAAATSATNADGSASAALSAKTDAVNAKTGASTSASAAAQSKTDAAGSASSALTAKTDAVNAKTGAQTSATAANTSATNADGSAKAANVAKTDAVNAKTGAQTSATAANTSATNADGSAKAANVAKTDAVNAKNGAQTSATAANTSATNADGSAKSANAAKTDAVNAKTGAQTSASAANTSATNANGSANAALTAKTDAVSAKNAASTSASAALQAKTDAQGAASASLTAKSNAESASEAAASAKSSADGSASAAIAAKNTATDKATGASNSATAAATSAVNADGSASAALTSKTDSENAATGAKTSATAAATSATNADGSASAALTAKTDAVNAKTGAETSASAAVQAKTDAQGAASAALTSKNSAVDANNASSASAKASKDSAAAALTAKTDAVNAKTGAQTSASAASTSATNASGSASSANTAKTDAVNAKTGAAQSASAANTSATNASGSASSANTAKTDAVNAKNGAAQSASAASTSAESADGSAKSALSASSTTTSARDETVIAKDAAAGSATDASGSASAANTSKGQAASSASAANTSKGQAAGSATAASGSASAANTSKVDAVAAASRATTSAAASVAASVIAGKSAELVSQVSLVQGLLFDSSKPNVSWSTSTNYAGSKKFVMSCDNAGKAALRVRLLDAEEDVQVAFNGVQVGTNLTGSDNELKWYDFIVDAVYGDNEVAIWATSSDGGSIKEIELRGADAENRVSAAEARMEATEEEAYYSIKVDNGGNVAGFGLTANPQGTAILFTADQIGFKNSTGNGILPFSVRNDIVYINNARVSTLEANSIINVDDVNGSVKRASLGNTIIEGDFELVKSGQITWRDLDPDIRASLVTYDVNAVLTGGTRANSINKVANGTTFLAKNGDTTNPPIVSGGAGQTLTLSIKGGVSDAERQSTSTSKPKIRLLVYRREVGKSGVIVYNQLHEGFTTVEDGNSQQRTYTSYININSTLDVSTAIAGKNYEFYFVISEYAGSWGASGGSVSVSIRENVGSSGGVVVSSLAYQGNVKVSAVEEGIDVAGTISSAGITSTGQVIAGQGSGAVSLSTNDGHGNANLTFNHHSGVPDMTGNSARVEVNVDSNTNANFNFELASGVTKGQALTLKQVLNISESLSNFSTDVKVSGKLHINGEITSGSGAGLQVNGFIRSGVIFIHEGGNTPTAAGLALGNTSGKLVWDGSNVAMQSQLAAYIPLAGGTLTGELNFNNSGNVRRYLIKSSSGGIFTHSLQNALAFHSDSTCMVFAGDAPEKVLIGLGYYENDHTTEDLILASDNSIRILSGQQNGYNGTTQAIFHASGLFQAPNFKGNTFEGELDGNAKTVTNGAYAVANNVFKGNNKFLSTDVNGGYQNAAIELRETNYVGTSQSSNAYAPAISFHWGARQQGRLALHSDGHFYFADGVNHTTLRPLHASFIGNLSGNASTSSNSDKLSNQVLSSSSTANTVVQRNGNGDINARLFRSEYDSQNTSVTGFLMTQNDTGSDNYIRPISIDNFLNNNIRNQSHTFTGQITVKNPEPYLTVQSTDAGSSHIRWAASDGAETALMYSRDNGHVTLRVGRLNASHQFYASGDVLLGGSVSVGGNVGLAGSLANGKAIAIGDADTGFRQNGDGVLETYCNNQLISQSTTTSHDFSKDLVTNAKLIVHGTHGIRSDGWIHLQRYNSNTKVAIGNDSSNVNLEVLNGKTTLNELEVAASSAMLTIYSSIDTELTSSTIRMSSANGQNVDIRHSTFNSERAPYGIQIETSRNITTTEKAYLEVEGDIYVGGYFYGESKQAFSFRDSFLRINDTKAFSSGIYMGRSNLRTDAELHVGSSGSKFRVTGAGTVISAANINAGGYMYAKSHGSNITNSKVLTFNDFLPDEPPVGLENTITANWISSGAIQTKHLQVNGVVGAAGDRRSLRITPDAQVPISFALLNNDLSVKRQIFSIDSEGNAFLDGKLSKDTVDIDSIQDQARTEINPYYVGTNANSTKSVTASQSGTSITTTLPAVTVLGNKVNLSWMLVASSQFAGESSGGVNYTSPVWRVRVYRNTTSTTPIVDKTYTGTSSNTNENGRYYDSNANLSINDLYQDINVTDATEVYVLQVTRVNGTPTTITRTFWQAQSPAFKRIEMELDYTLLYYNASGLTSGTITLASDMRAFQFVSVLGSSNNNDTIKAMLLPVADLVASYTLSDLNQFVLWGGEGANIWKVRPNTSWTSLTNTGEDATIFKVSGVNIVEKDNG